MLASADDLKDKRNKVQQSVKAAEEHLEGSSRAMYTATARLRSARVQLLLAQRKLAKTQGELTTARILDAQMQAKLVAAVAELGKAKHRLKVGQVAVVEQRKSIGRLAVASFEFGDPGLLRMSVLLNGASPEEISTQLGTIDSLMQSQSSMLADLRAKETLLEVERTRVAKAKEDVAQKRQEAAVNLARKKALEKEAVTNRAQVAALVHDRASAAYGARVARLADRRKLVALRQEESRIQRLIIARAQRAKGGYQGSNNGFLYRPVNGPITSPFGYRRHPIYGYWGLHDGVDFRAPCGTPLHAGAGGTVISEYYSDVWGNRLLLDVGRVNGKSMILIYNHISSYRVRTGAKVSRGEVVAYSGTTGWSTACHLHFTVMLDGTAVNPTKFF
jgi:murein DD-endopeptidase MepM/ murein hydrolase activator NlpD